MYQYVQNRRHSKAVHRQVFQVLDEKFENKNMKINDMRLQIRKQEKHRKDEKLWE